MYLLNTKTGEVFCYNERLAAKPGFVKRESLESAKDDGKDAATEAAVKAAATKQRAKR